MSDHPAALQLRLLETVVQVAAEKNSTLVLPFPVELLRFLEHNSGGPPPKRTPDNGASAELEQSRDGLGDQPHDEAGHTDTHQEHRD
jgi:hypothetical protein